MMRRSNATLGSLVFLLLAGLFATAYAQDSVNRTVLPIPEPERQTYTELDVRDATPPKHFEVKAPADAPNVLIVLVDDLGFAGTHTFGGPFTTPKYPLIFTIWDLYMM